MISRACLLVFLLVPLIMGAQEDDPCGPPTDKKVVKLLESAEKARDAMERHRILKEALEVDQNCALCLYLLGSSAFDRARESNVGFKPALSYLQRLQDRCPDYNANVHYLLGVIKYAERDFGGAYQSFRKFEDTPFDGSERDRRTHDKKLADVEEIMPELQFYAEFYKNDRPLDPVVVRNVSSPADEYLPMLSPDNEIMFYTRKRMYKAKGDIVSKEIEELSESRRKDLHSEFDGGTALPEPFNVGDNYGGVSISVNNKEMFVTICKPTRPDYKDCNIYRTHYDQKFDLDSGTQEWFWSGTDDLGANVNSEGWESQPSLSSDGRTLYFSRINDKTRNMDIMMSQRGDDGQWSLATPLPYPINTDSADKAPFMHSDSRTLYFASKGHPGGGGYDIFFSKLNEDGSWTRPTNLGHPINTEQDEHGLIVSADGRTAYFASNRYKGVGGLDVYSFALHKDLRPDEIVVVKGQVKDEHGEIVKDAELEIKYMDTKKTEIIRVDASDGRYATVVNLEKGGDVVMTVKKKDHVFDSRAFTMEDTLRGGVAEVDMKLEKIEVGKSYRVNDINYATNSAEITKASEHIIEELIGFLKENPTIKIAVHGHTDDVGSLADNMALSHDRAYTVVEYLGSHGIKGSRLSFEGFGPTRPVADNTTPEGRARNRRTEFVIVSR